MDEDILHKLAAKRPGLSARRQAEMELWNQWKASGEDPVKLEPLVASFQNLAQSQVRKFSGRVPLPTPVIEAEVNQQLLNAFRTYDPNYVGKKSGKPAALSTHVYGLLRKSGRFIKKYQNVGAIPEKRINKITEYKGALSQLSEDFGREPTSMEISDKLQWAPAEVNRMQLEMRRDLLTSGYEGAVELSNPSSMIPPKDLEIIRLIKYELAPREYTVLEYSLGLNGKPTLGTGEIARRIGVSAPTVSRIKNKVEKKFREYGGGI